MNNEKIAILTDSCADVPKEYVEKYGIYVMPLSVVYKDKTYTDGVDISAQEIYDRFDQEIPSTSLPAGDTIMSILEKIKSDGYEKVLAITISSGLSGTYNFVRLIGEGFEGLEVFTVDTKNIGIGSGMVAILAAENAESGLSWEELKDVTQKSVEKSRIFFCVSTLKYLHKGGRIGLVSAMIGERLNLKPIISCNEDGIYYSAAKAMGRQKSLQKAIELTEQFVSSSSSKIYNLTIVHGNALKEAMEVKEQIVSKLKNYKAVFEGQISPVLVVHTGPGLIGIGAQLL